MTEEEKEERIAWIKAEITRLENFLSSNNPISATSIDGMSVTIDRKSILEEIYSYRLELARIDGSRPIITNIEFGSMF